MGGPVARPRGALWLGTSVLLLLLLLEISESCTETAWSRGRMASSRRLDALTLTARQAGSCTCCALCHQRPDCASLSYNSRTAECELYGSVASYATLQPESDEWSYFVMPGRSETGQFCRQDGDCLTDGEFCRGRFCTALEKVTCRTVTDTFGSLRHYDVEPRLYGWINGEQVMLLCWMSQKGTGMTTILWSTNGLQFNATTLMQYNLNLEDGDEGQSLLGLAEDIRLSESHPFYKIYVWTQDGSSWRNILNYEAPRSEPVLSRAARTDVWLNVEQSGGMGWRPSMLWRPGTGPTLLTINADDGYATRGAMARADGAIRNSAIWIYLYE